MPLGFGKSMNFNDTSDGIDKAAPPILDSRGAEVEKDRGAYVAKAGTRNAGKELARADSRRSWLPSCRDRLSDIFRGPATEALASIGGWSGQLLSTRDAPGEMLRCAKDWPQLR